MGRHVLLHHGQRWLQRKIMARQPLVERVTKQQQLLQVFGRTARAPQREGMRWEQRFNRMQQRALSPVRTVFRPPLKGQSQEAPAEVSALIDNIFEREDGEYSGQEVSSVLAAESAENSDEIASLPLPGDPAGTPDQQLAREDQHLDVQDQRVVGGEPLLEQPISERAEASNPVYGEPLLQREEADQPPPSIESGEVQAAKQVKVKRSKGRIEEQPAGAGHNQALPLVPPADVARRNVQQMTAPETVRGNQAEISQETPAADDLFAPRDTDRSPQAWLARLTRASSVTADPPGETIDTGGNEQSALPTMEVRFAPVNEESVTNVPQSGDSQGLKAASHEQIRVRAYAARDASQTSSVPMPLSQRARRFLQPLVGIDPATVRVYRDALAERLTDAFQADAITIGDDIALATGHSDDSPETLGLLAHELTHVARLREPHFIPPVARVVKSGPVHTSIPDTGAPSKLFAPADEEPLARRVEGRVTRAAQDQADQATALSMTPAVGGPVVGANGLAHGSWGGLPAPWEPLPDWLASSTATIESSTYTTAVSPLSVQEAHSGTLNGSKASDGGVQRAGVERSLNEDGMREEQSTASMQQPTPDRASVPEPDLDALARQVYAHLKRRLEVERRRER